MYSKIRKRLRAFMRENREKPIVGFLYRRLKIHEKKKYLRTFGREIVVALEKTKEIYLQHQEWFEIIRAYIKGKTLDVGSKYGMVTEGKDVVALDIVKEFLNVNLHQDKILADATNLPFIDNSFTSVVATEILEHLEHPEKAVNEMERVLKEGGRAIISVPDRYNFFSEVEHIQYFTLKSLNYLLRRFKVDMCKTLSTGHIFGVFKKA